ncbi:ribosomal-protein-serine acetyltransferase [Empedobacter brevis NBRC 14943 = ATCC 43319]|uniref:Ribosomal-protein-serine acetyltransferase n=1 Tax=Empedobacter brevis NBRC 14943 = ATCC 43319 TaxID=1218108 RepID=A0A511NEL6_9FLAO|nr:GNAT family N-acetyltransferase [Empedobacter brevis]GEM50771.1 ribosomal-protein-serine acetyltransferase [Empedobacter brevis NBRC 14943 = ATCC 43319]
MNMNLQTERLNLNPVSEKDIEDIFALQSLEETARFNTSKVPETIEETKETVEKWIIENKKDKAKQFTFAVHLLNENQFIGLIGMNLGKEHYKNAEVWFQLHYKFWNKGYATESLNKILDFGFEELKLHRIEAGCAIDNIGSVSVLEKVGMLREAHTRKLLPLQSGWSDNYGYAILSTDKRK